MGMTFDQATKLSNEYSKQYRRYHTAIYVGKGTWKVTDKFHPRGNNENH